MTSLGFDCRTSSKISSAESHTERRCSKQQQNGGKDRTKHTLQNISRKAVAQVKKAVWIRTRKKRQVLAAFHLAMWERALRTVTYFTSSTTTFSNECRWKSASQVAHLLFHNDNESEKHFSDSLHFRFISSTANTTVLRPKSAKNLQTATTTTTTTRSSSLSQWKSRKPIEEKNTWTSSSSTSSCWTEFRIKQNRPPEALYSRNKHREPLTQLHNEGENKTKKMQYIDGQILKV